MNDEAMPTEYHIPREEAKLCVGAGWHKLIDRVYDDLPDGVIVVQVKEKLGGLRVYVEHAVLDFFDLLGDIEIESLQTCEKCGEAGEPREGGWIRTRCNSCAGS